MGGEGRDFEPPQTNLEEKGDVLIRSRVSVDRLGRGTKDGIKTY